MVQTVAQPAGSLQYVVLRPIFIAGERKEVGDAVTLARQVGAELVAAHKVAPAPAPAAAPAAEAEPDADAAAPPAKGRAARKA